MKLNCTFQANTKTPKNNTYIIKGIENKTKTI